MLRISTGRLKSVNEDGTWDVAVVEELPQRIVIVKFKETFGAFIVPDTLEILKHEVICQLGTFSINGKFVNHDSEEKEEITHPSHLVDRQLLQYVTNEQEEWCCQLRATAYVCYLLGMTIFILAINYKLICVYGGACEFLLKTPLFAFCIDLLQLISEILVAVWNVF